MVITRYSFRLSGVRVELVLTRISGFRCSYVLVWFGLLLACSVMSYCICNIQVSFSNVVNMYLCYILILYGYALPFPFQFSLYLVLMRECHILFAFFQDH